MSKVDRAMFKTTLDEMAANHGRGTNISSNRTIGNSEWEQRDIKQKSRSERESGGFYHDTIKGSALSWQAWQHLSPRGLSHTYHGARSLRPSGMGSGSRSA